MQKKGKKRSTTDRIISAFNSVKFLFTEPIILKIMRLLYEKDYSDKDANPLITVYIPTYNRAEILMERAVPTVLAQTYKNFELLIIGDCCTDKTTELVREIKDPRVRYYNLPKRGYRYPPTAENHWLAGPVVAANEALKMAKGKWIARIDDDDTWTEDCLESLLRFAQEGNYEFVSGQYLEERDGVQRIDRGAGAQDQYYTRSDKPIVGLNPVIGGTQTWLYRSYLKFIRYNINCWRKDWNRVNDIDLSERIFKSGARIGFLEKVLAFVVPRPGETTVGVEAYLIKKEEKEEHFKFQ